jgi:hypothetical protein
MFALPLNTQGGSPVRELRSPGSVRGVLRKEYSYRDILSRFYNSQKLKISIQIYAGQVTCSVKRSVHSVILSISQPSILRGCSGLAMLMSYTDVLTVESFLDHVSLALGHADKGEFVFDLDDAHELFLNPGVFPD